MPFKRQSYLFPILWKEFGKPKQPEFKDKPLLYPRISVLQKFTHKIDTKYTQNRTQTVKSLITSTKIDPYGTHRILLLSQDGIAVSIPQRCPHQRPFLTKAFPLTRAHHWAGGLNTSAHEHWNG